jgi:hypothetical protein
MEVREPSKISPLGTLNSHRIGFAVGFRWPALLRLRSGVARVYTLGVMTHLTHHGTALRFICDVLWRGVYDEIGDVEDARAERLRESVVPIVPGASIILACSYAELVWTDLKSTMSDAGAPRGAAIPSVADLPGVQSYFDLDAQWPGWQELANFFRLRHCFAHAH